MEYEEEGEFEEFEPTLGGQLELFGEEEEGEEEIGEIKKPEKPGKKEGEEDSEEEGEEKEKEEIEELALIPAFESMTVTKRKEQPNVVPEGEELSLPVMTMFEFVALIRSRAKELIEGAIPVVEFDPYVLNNPIDLAVREFEEGALDNYKVVRVMPSGRVEKFAIGKMTPPKWKKQKSIYNLLRLPGL